MKWRFFHTVSVPGISLLSDVVIHRYSKQYSDAREFECVLQYDAAVFSYVILMWAPRQTGKRTQGHLSLAFQRFKQCLKE